MAEDDNSFRKGLEALSHSRLGFGEKIQKIIEYCLLNNQQIEILQTHTDANSFNCHTYTLGLVNSSRIFNLARIYAMRNKTGGGQGKHLVSGNFIGKLIDKGFLVEDATGNIAVYYDATKAITHSGLIQADGHFIASKWGREGLWKHPVFVAPYSYGNEVKRFRLTLSEKEVINLLELEFSN